jgi:hypothetical protein
MAVESDSNPGECLDGPASVETSPVKDGLLGPRLNLRHGARKRNGAQPGLASLFMPESSRVS